MVYPVTNHRRGLPRHHLHDDLRAANLRQHVKNMGAELPLPTKIVMWMSDMTRKYVIVMLAGVAAAFYAIKRYYGTDQGSMLIDTFALKVPVVGMLIARWPWRASRARSAP